MKIPDHPDDSSIIQYLDGELQEEQFADIKLHIASCVQCSQRQSELARLSDGIEAFVSSCADKGTIASRVRLAQALASGSGSRIWPESPVKVMRRFGWGMAIAASLAIGIVFMPKPINLAEKMESAKAAPVSTATSIDVNGESFVAVPYSNPALPISAPRIVQMQIPVSSLASAGLLMEPVANELGDRTVLANVLLGLDGQPVGVHVLNAE